MIHPYYIAIHQEPETITKCAPRCDGMSFERLGLYFSRGCAHKTKDCEEVRTAAAAGSGRAKRLLHIPLYARAHKLYRFIVILFAAICYMFLYRRRHGGWRNWRASYLSE